MSFIWPVMLILLLLIPLCVVLYLRMQRRRRRLMASYGSMGLVQTARASARRAPPHSAGAVSGRPDDPDHRAGAASDGCQHPTGRRDGDADI